LQLFLKFESHAAPAIPVVVHELPMFEAGHVLSPQFVSGLQLTSHWHEFAQLIVPHASEPFWQIAFNDPAPVVMLPHAPEPSHVTEPDPPSVLIVPHAPLPPLQPTKQPPAPHVTLPQAEPPVQVALPPPVPNVSAPQLFEPRHVSTQ